jgi:hypothetical protein
MSVFWLSQRIVVPLFIILSVVLSVLLKKIEAILV